MNDIPMPLNLVDNTNNKEDDEIIDDNTLQQKNISQPTIVVGAVFNSPTIFFSLKINNFDFLILNFEFIFLTFAPQNPKCRVCVYY